MEYYMIHLTLTNGASVELPQDVLHLGMASSLNKAAVDFEISKFFDLDTVSRVFSLKTDATTIYYSDLPKDLKAAEAELVKIAIREKAKISLMNEPAPKKLYGVKANYDLASIFLLDFNPMGDDVKGYEDKYGTLFVEMKDGTKLKYHAVDNAADNQFCYADELRVMSDEDVEYFSDLVDDGVNFYEGRVKELY